MSLFESTIRSASRYMDLPRWVLLGMLASLHLAMLLGVENPSGRAVLVAHFGFFLLWQPFIRSAPELRLSHLFLVGLLLFATLTWLSWWAITLWLILLAGIVGGRVFLQGGKSRRVFYLFAFGYLISALLLIAVPYSLPPSLVQVAILQPISKFALPFVLALMCLLPLSREGQQEERTFDLVYSAFIILGLAAMVFGTITEMLLRSHSYVEALLETLMTIAFMLLALGLVWPPRAGFAGLGSLITRYMLSSGMSFEHWLDELTELAAREEEAPRFVRRACENLLQELPWLVGCRWVTDEGPEETGICQGIEASFSSGSLQLVLYSRREFPPSLLWHFRLLVQLLETFRQDKLRARQIRKMATLAAIHETGARLTHDVKNLLQSLNTLCSAAEREGENLSPQYQALLRRQLPAVSQRLKLTLDKFRKPEQIQQNWLPAEAWWAQLCRSYEGQDIVFQLSHGLGELRLPVACFSCAAENLIQNALEKRHQEPELKIEVVLDGVAGKACLRVSDTGSCVSAAVASHLGREVLSSDHGFGVGLYQVEQEAKQVGYRLCLIENTEGSVCFELSPNVE